MSGFLTKLAGVNKRELLDTVKARKLAYCGNKQGHYSNFVFAGRCSFLGQQNVGRIFSSKVLRERDNARNNVRCTQARKTWTDNIKTRTGLSVEESVRMAYFSKVSHPHGGRGLCTSIE